MPSSSAWARSRPLNRRLPARPCAIPARIWLVMTPELPRAPISAPKLAACATPLDVGVGPDLVGLLERRAHRRQHVRAGVAVGDREHVEGVDLVDVRLEARDGAPERRQEARRRRTIGGPSGDVRPAAREVGGPRLVAGVAPRPARARGRARGAGGRCGSRSGRARGPARRPARSGRRRRPGARPPRPAGRRRPRGRGRRSAPRRRRGGARGGRCRAARGRRPRGPPPEKPVTP